MAMKIETGVAGKEVVYRNLHLTGYWFLMV